MQLPRRDRMAHSSSAPLKTSTRFAPALKRPLPLAKEERAIGPSLLRTLVLPDEVERWSLTTLREKIVKIGAKVYSFARNALSQNCRTREARGRRNGHTLAFPAGRGAYRSRAKPPAMRCPKNVVVTGSPSDPVGPNIELLGALCPIANCRPASPCWNVRSLNSTPSCGEPVF